MARSKISVKVDREGYGKFKVDGIDVTESVTGVLFRSRPGGLPILTFDTNPEEVIIRGDGEIRIICPLCKMEMTQTVYMATDETLRSCWVCGCPPRIEPAKLNES